MRDTAHLTEVEECIYSRCIDQYYSREKALPSDLSAVCRLVRATSKAAVAAVNTVLPEFFVLKDDGWHQKRCDAELERYAEKSAKASHSASKRWGKTHSEGNANASPNAMPMDMRTHSDGNASQEPIANSQEPKEKPKPALSTVVLEPQEPERTKNARASPVEISIEMRKHGVDSQSADPRIIALAEQGVSIETCCAACAEAKRAKPGERIGIGYVVKIIERWTRDASAMSVNGAIQSGQQRCSKEDFDRIARELGMEQAA